jgi:hypothetical protein
MRNRFLENIVLSSSNKTGEKIKIKVITGLYKGEEFEAKKVKEHLVYCYHIEKDGIKTYLNQDDIIEIA